MKLTHLWMVNNDAHLKVIIRISVNTGNQFCTISGNKSTPIDGSYNYSPNIRTDKSNHGLLRAGLAL